LYKKRHGSLCLSRNGSGHKDRQVRKRMSIIEGGRKTNASSRGSRPDARPAFDNQEPSDGLYRLRKDGLGGTPAIPTRAQLEMRSVAERQEALTRMRKSLGVDDVKVGLSSL
jgi:hypothetical protein